MYVHLAIGRHVCWYMSRGNLDSPNPDRHNRDMIQTRLDSAPVPELVPELVTLAAIESRVQSRSRSRRDWESLTDWALRVIPDLLSASVEPDLERDRR